MHEHSLCLWDLVFQAIQEQIKLHGQEPVSFQDVKVHTHTNTHSSYSDIKAKLFFSVSCLKTMFDPQDEIFDMVKPKDPYKITLQDLVNSCQGDTVTSILIDLNGFWTYENREVLVANDNDSIGAADLIDS